MAVDTNCLQTDRQTDRRGTMTVAHKFTKHAALIFRGHLMHFRSNTSLWVIRMCKMDEVMQKAGISNAWHGWSYAKGWNQWRWPMLKVTGSALSDTHMILHYYTPTRDTYTYPFEILAGHSQKHKKPRGFVANYNVLIQHLKCYHCNSCHMQITSWWLYWIKSEHRLTCSSYRCCVIACTRLHWFQLRNIW